MRTITFLLFLGFILLHAASADDIVYQFNGNYRSMESYSGTNDVPLIGYTIWAVTYGTTTTVTLVENHDLQATEKKIDSIRKLAEQRASEPCEALHFVDNPRQAQKHIYLHPIVGTRDKPELLLIARFGRGLPQQNREEQRRADWVWNDFLNSFNQFELNSVLKKYRETKKSQPAAGLYSPEDGQKSQR